MPHPGKQNICFSSKIQKVIHWCITAYRAVCGSVVFFIYGLPNKGTIKWRIKTTKKGNKFWRKGRHGWVLSHVERAAISHRLTTPKKLKVTELSKGMQSPSSHWLRSICLFAAHMALHNAAFCPSLSSFFFSTSHMIMFLHGFLHNAYICARYT